MSHQGSQSEGHSDERAKDQSGVGTRVRLDLAHVYLDVANVLLDMLHRGFELGDTMFHAWIMGPIAAAVNGPIVSRVLLRRGIES